jgi:hypothetical protein
MGMKLLKVVFVVLLCCGGSAQAVPITIQISGNVTYTNGSGLPGTIHVGDTFTGNYTYDSSTDVSGNGHHYYDTPYGISLSLGGYEFKTAPNHVGQFDMLIINDGFGGGGITDYYTVFSDKNIFGTSVGPTNDWIGWLRWDLWDSSHTALSSDALPVTAPVLTAWNHNVLEIYGYGFGSLSIIKGTVTQVTPEPLTGVLMAIGVFFLRHKR